MQFIVNIDVEEIEEAISFYESGLGLRLIRRLFDGTVAWGKLVTLSDPFGNGSCLLAFADGGYDHAK